MGSLESEGRPAPVVAMPFVAITPSTKAQRSSFQCLDDLVGLEERYERESLPALDAAQARSYEVWRHGRLRRVLRSEVSALLRAGVVILAASQQLPL